MCSLVVAIHLGCLLLKLLQWESHSGAVSAKKWKTSLRVREEHTGVGYCLPCSTCRNAARVRIRMRICIRMMAACCMQLYTSVLTPAHVSNGVQVRPGGAPGVPPFGNGMMVRGVAGIKRCLARVPAVPLGACRVWLLLPRSLHASSACAAPARFFHFSGAQVA